MVHNQGKVQKHVHVHVHVHEHEQPWLWQGRAHGGGWVRLHQVRGHDRRSGGIGLERGVNLILITGSGGIDHQSLSRLGACGVEPGPCWP